MKQAAIASLAMLALTVSGCARHPDAPPAAKDTKDTKAIQGFDAIHLERTACFGECPVYQLDIARDGSGSFTGKEFVKAKGVREVRLSPGDVALMSAVLERSGFASWKASYLSAEDGCTTMYTDNPSVTISVTKGGKTKTVMLYQGCSGPAVPTEAVDWLANTIDFLANIRALTLLPR
ncbi:DUF6438 domain-containing protein [Massilia aerilata]|uniref:DUF6438 domain-containing protein n=1 Tax=Massilia aerilata TaxID=453817 RepID=A0ABW0RSG3_9BURK